MSFIFTDNAPFEWPVEVCIPDGGAYTVSKITGLFEQVDDEVFLARPEGDLTNSAAVQFEIGRLMTVFKGWAEGDVLTPDKQPVACTPENIAKFLAKRPVRLAVTDAYMDAITPQKGYRAKNSAPPQA